MGYNSSNEGLERDGARQSHMDTCPHNVSSKSPEASKDEDCNCPGVGYLPPESHEQKEAESNRLASTPGWSRKWGKKHRQEDLILLHTFPSDNFRLRVTHVGNSAWAPKTQVPRRTQASHQEGVPPPLPAPPLSPARAPSPRSPPE
ncbi:hypothetical protein K458DRAFT_484220 [Lentithecium fluviatile CBS 122367]|uniref:Uncharacterized protein n=1 Tax=Lentithecium fluviatile CBS 122367 TaxID=1168545 RepID=A0A6G1JG72_9PLEO|nr:hypothetical protein K458DRAFT_484220 [Lentithecium fluviatile CBS 122367]